MILDFYWPETLLAVWDAAGRPESTNGMGVRCRSSGDGE